MEALSLCFPRETIGIVQNLGLTDAERKDVSAIIDMLQRYVDGYLNETVERQNFSSPGTAAGETFNNFLILF